MLNINVRIIKNNVIKVFLIEFIVYIKIVKKDKYIENFMLKL